MELQKRRNLCRAFPEFLDRLPQFVFLRNGPAHFVTGSVDGRPPLGDVLLKRPQQFLRGLLHSLGAQGFHAGNLAFRSSKLLQRGDVLVDDRVGVLLGLFDLGHGGKRGLQRRNDVVDGRLCVATDLGKLRLRRLHRLKGLDVAVDGLPITFSFLLDLRQGMKHLVQRLDVSVNIRRPVLFNQLVGIALIHAV